MTGREETGGSGAEKGEQRPLPKCGPKRRPHGASEGRAFASAKKRKNARAEFWNQEIQRVGKIDSSGGSDGYESSRKFLPAVSARYLKISHGRRALSGFVLDFCRSGFVQPIKAAFL